MQDKLLIQLEKYAQNQQLKQYNSLSINAAEKLYRLTEEKITTISELKSTQTNPNILIAEADEIEFLAAFMAGVIQSVNIFLGDRAWGRQEWQQVFDLVTPDLIFGDRPQEIFALENTGYPNTTARETAQSLIMIPTGGTSGKVRFTMHTWSTLSASVFGFQQHFNCSSINSCCTLPLHHVSGLMQFTRSFLTQGNLILCPYREIARQDFSFERRDYFISLVPTQLQYLIDRTPEHLAKFKTVLVGGAAVGRSLLDLARKYKIPLATTYGMTETASGIVTLKPEDFWAGNNSSGQILPHAQVTVERDRHGVKDKLGLIKISCASLFLGYYPQVRKSELMTDDLGYFDSDRYLHIVGRNSQKIITGGENVFPAEVEAAIWSTKLIKDICVIGIEDARWGQVVTAIYVPIKPDLNLESIEQKIQPQLAKYKQPKVWIAVDRLPRNDRGKINYQKLRTMCQGR